MTNTMSPIAMDRECFLASGKSKQDGLPHTCEKETVNVVNIKYEWMNEWIIHTYRHIRICFSFDVLRIVRIMSLKEQIESVTHCNGTRQPLLLLSSSQLQVWFLYDRCNWQLEMIYGDLFYFRTVTVLVTSHDRVFSHALVQIMAWHWPGDKTLSEPMMLRLLMHIYFTQPQWQ